MDFEFSPKVKDLQQRVGAFMDEHVYPNEARFHEEIAANRRAGNAWVPTRIVEELKQKAQAQGLWNLWLPESEFGAGLTNLEYAPLCEIMGRSHLGPGGLQLLRARHRQHGGAGALRQRGAEARVAHAAARGRDPLGLRDDRARGRLVRRDQHRGQHRARRRPLRDQRPQVVDLGRRRPALPDPDLHGQDRSAATRTATASSR